MTISKVVWEQGDWQIVQRGEKHFNAVVGNVEYSGLRDMDEEPPIPVMLERILAKYNGCKRMNENHPNFFGNCIEVESGLDKLFEE